MKKTSILLLSLAWLTLAVSDVARAAEDWKGEPNSSEFDLGALSGMGVIDSRAGFVLMGTASKKIVHHGFVPDINNSVSIEAEMGPLFVYGTAVFAYSFHLRWDFEKDANWTLYALGGLAGDVTGDGGGNSGGRFILFPRFGIGAMYHITSLVGIRGELSRELIAAGVVFPF